ncbi:MAG: three-Cys-motif partner protein TcmP [Eubacteriales bacterium]
MNKEDSMAQQPTQQFGGNWTEEKLNIFTDYLSAYLMALQNQKFGKIYIDAFAGTGEIITCDGEQHLVGSAKRALSADLKFDHYYFVEESKKKVSELQKMIYTEFSNLVDRVTIYCGDATVPINLMIPIGLYCQSPILMPISAIPVSVVNGWLKCRKI